MHRFPMHRMKTIIRGEDFDLHVTQEALFILNKAMKKFLKQFTKDASLEELCEVGRGRVVSSPRDLMRDMTPYIPNFNLTAQQDVAEAFLHLLSCLREEFSECYLPNQCSLVDVSASSCRILIPRMREDWSEQERWKEHFLGPFDGILGSILTCQSCSAQVHVALIKNKS